MEGVQKVAIAGQTVGAAVTKSMYRDVRNLLAKQLVDRPSTSTPSSA